MSDEEESYWFTETPTGYIIENDSGYMIWVDTSEYSSLEKQEFKYWVEKWK